MPVLHFGGDRRSGSSGVRYAHSHHRFRGGPPAIKRGCLGLQNLNLRSRYSIRILFPTRRWQKPVNHRRHNTFRHTPTSFCRISCRCVPEADRLLPKTTPSHEFLPDFLHVCPRSRPIAAQNNTVTQVFARFLACVSLKHADYCPK